MLSVEDVERKQRERGCAPYDRGEWEAAALMMATCDWIGETPDCAAEGELVGLDRSAMLRIEIEYDAVDRIGYGAPFGVAMRKAGAQ